MNKLKYFLDTEFIENGSTIDLISIGIVSEDGRSFYRQNSECMFDRAGDWVWRNVFPHLAHFDMRGKRACDPKHESYDSGLGHRYFTSCADATCPWANRQEISQGVLEFCATDKDNKPEFWGYFADYDWVAFCQLFGPMVALPKGYPMYCNDLKQLSKQLGNVELPKPEVEIHHALADAEWIKEYHKILSNIRP